MPMSMEIEATVAEVTEDGSARLEIIYKGLDVGVSEMTIDGQPLEDEVLQAIAGKGERLAGLQEKAIQKNPGKTVKLLPGTLQIKPPAAPRQQRAVKRGTGRHPPRKEQIVARGHEPGPGLKKPQAGPACNPRQPAIVEPTDHDRIDPLPVG